MIWRAGVLAKPESLETLGVCEPVKLADIRGSEILRGRLVFVIRLSLEGEKGKNKAWIVGTELFIKMR